MHHDTDNAQHFWHSRLPEGSLGVVLVIMAAGAAWAHEKAIYAGDEAFRSLPPAKRKLMRAQHLRPLLEGFFDWVRQVRPTTVGRNLITSALSYTSNQEKELLRVLDDGRLPGPVNHAGHARSPDRN
jgi:transposase IS66 family protein